jgi:hypothetical protein
MKIIYACLDFVGWNKLLVFASSPRSCMQIACTWQKEKELDFNLTPCFSFVVLSGQFSNHFLGDLKILVSEDLVTLNRNNY